MSDIFRLVREPLHSFTVQRLAEEVRRRRCPDKDCNRELRTASVTVEIGRRSSSWAAEDRVVAVVEFTCWGCNYNKKTEMDLNVTLVREVEKNYLASLGPVSGDEVIDVHEALRRPDLTIKDLIDSRAEVHP